MNAPTVPRRLALSGALALAALLARGREADAQVLSRFTLTGEVGAGSMEFLAPREASTYAPVVQSAARLNVAVFDVLEAQAAVVNWGPTTGGHDVLGLLMGGRLHRDVGRVGRTFAELNVGFCDVGQPGWEPMFEAAVGFEFRVTSWLNLGPVFRFAQVYGADFEPDHRMLTLGASLSLRVPPSEPPPPPFMPAGTEVEGVGERVHIIR